MPREASTGLSLLLLDLASDKLHDLPVINHPFFEALNIAYTTMWGPPVISYLVNKNPMNTIAISIIKYHKPVRDIGVM